MYEKRINRLISAMKARGADAALIASRENRFFLSGFTGETGAILVTEKSRTLFVEQCYALQATMETKDFSVANTDGGLYNSINDTIIGDGVKKVIFEDAFFTVSAYRSLSKRLRCEELIPAGDLMLRLRAVKDQSEISAITEAAELTSECFRYVRDILKVGITEEEISFKTEMHLRGLGALPAFTPITVSGAHTALPSAISGTKEIAFGDVVIVNLGVAYKGYRTDCSRTFFMGSADEKGRELYEAVLSAQSSVLAEAKTGVPCRDVEMKARASISDAGLKDSYHHCVGGGIGISNRELPYISLRSGDTLCTNMTLSLGVGAYEGGYGGVRMTDTVVVTPNGALVLTDVPNELIVL